jgi:hypothetical protein
MRLPLRIVRIEAGLKIIDADGLSIAYVYAEAEESRRNVMKLLTPEQAEDIAKQIARALTAAIGE